jgi:hypothetical protein
MNKGKYYNMICSELFGVIKCPNQYWLNMIKQSLVHKFQIQDFDEFEWGISLAWAIADKYGDGCEIEDL